MTEEARVEKAIAAYGTENGQMTLADLARFVQKAYQLDIDPDTAFPTVTTTVRHGQRIKTIRVSG